MTDSMIDSMIDSMTNHMTDLMADSITNIMNKSMTDRGVNLMTHAIMDPIADSMNDPMKNVTMISSHIFLHYCSRLLMVNLKSRQSIFNFRTTKYLKKASLTRTCAIGGFFLSIPLFLIGEC